MKKLILIAILTASSLSACGSKRSVVDDHDVASVPAQQLIDSHYENDFDKRTLYARLGVRYKGHKSSATIGIKLRMEKDKTIWMSATKLGIPIAKLKITPNRVIYYEKIQKVYFDGDFSLLSQWLGTELDFDKVQNMLLGQSLFDLNEGKYKASVTADSYTLSPKKNPKLYSFLLIMNPENFKMNKQEIRHRKKDQVLSVSYPKYSDIKGEQVPEKLQITALDNEKLTTINIEYRQVIFDRKLTFPFAVPEGYKELQFN